MRPTRDVQELAEAMRGALPELDPKDERIAIN